MYFKTQNGHTKQSMIDKINTEFKGKAIKEKSTPDSRIPDTCAYLTHDGKRCAVGLFIPSDNAEALGYEGNVNDLLNAFPDLAESMPLRDEALEIFQTIHDKNISDEMPLEEQKQVLIDWVTKNVSERR